MALAQRLTRSARSGSRCEAPLKRLRDALRHPSQLDAPLHPAICLQPQQLRASVGRSRMPSLARTHPRDARSPWSSGGTPRPTASATLCRSGAGECG